LRRGIGRIFAAARVGPAGKAIGIDMTSEMLELARRNAAKADGGKPIANVEFTSSHNRQAPFARRLRRLRYQAIA